MYRYKLKEIEVGDTETQKGQKTTVTDIDPRTGGITWSVEDVAAFDTAYKSFDEIRRFLKKLSVAGESKDDTKIDSISDQMNSLFNEFRTHLRKNYPDQYKKVLRLKEGTFHGPGEIAIYDGPDGETYIEKRGTGYYGYNNSFDFEAEDKAELKWKLNSWGYRLVAGSIDEDEGISYLTPDAFDKNKKSTGANDIYYYKLGYKPVPKKIKGSGLEVKQLWEKETINEVSDFQKTRINVFDEVEEKLNKISPLLSNAKNETIKYYNENPGTYTIVYSTDMVESLLEDITQLLN
tara:strand:+ start:3347 stop:4222 length:876 start_codon:yes stop_codon:yes gene_type:complete